MTAPYHPLGSVHPAAQRAAHVTAPQAPGGPAEGAERPEEGRASLLPSPPPAERPAPPGGPVPRSRSVFGRRTFVGNAGKAPRACSHCRERGHNAKTCPNAERLVLRSRWSFDP